MDAITTEAPRARRAKSRNTKMSETELVEVWEQFFASKAAGTPDEDLQTRLVNHYYPLTVKKVANKMHQRLTEVQPDELASMGVDGLYQAVMGFEKDRKVKFETYAMHRIRGAMLDEIRKADWIPRLVRAKCTWFDRQRQIHESQAGRKLTSAELAARISGEEKAIKYGIHTEADLEGFIQSVATPAMHSMNDFAGDGSDGRNEWNVVESADPRCSQPVDDMMRRELFAKLLGRNYTPIERKIIWLYYFEDRSMKEISERVGLSESRVSQMHGTILKRLRQTAERNPEYFGDIWSMISKFKGCQTVFA